ncbi:MAG TPA: MFS transporter [Chitinophagales bacterium]|nr:MFS transporter [Chitinophagales bacterium]HMX04370.1 MFS transporter [Chitinophagales bacterium]HNA57366.1 MFS transporter [Chitinophagales bacterium]HNI55265.1 MFS transporter [Chitinophagales bacterium]HNJ90576.1 MFS transporter [Chitinophagales bacterium]
MNPLHNRAFQYFLSMRVFITFAFLIQYVVAGWEIYSITKDPFSLGLIGLAEAIPAISIALYAGHLADISNKRDLLIGALVGMLLSSLGLTVFTSAFMREINSDHTTVMLMYLFIFTTGLARGFYGPTATAIIAQIVIPRKKSFPLKHTLDAIDEEEMRDGESAKIHSTTLVKASTTNSTVWQMSAIIGPALGGFLYGWIGMTGSMIAVLACIILGIAMLSQVPSTPPQPSQGEPILERLKAGIRFVFDNKIILNALSLDMFSVLFGGAVALLPVFANDILKCGPQGLGILRAMPSLGAVITISYISWKKIPGKVGTTLLWAVAGFGVTIILFGLSKNFYLSLFLLFLNGAFDSVSVVIRANIIQLLTPDNMRGRVSAVNTMFIGSSNELGAFESGLAARLLGTVPSVVFGGTITLCIVGFTSLRAKALKAFEY